MERVQLSAINLLTNPEDLEASNRRRPGRMRCESLKCTSGGVMDLSTTGVRIRVRSLLAPSRGGQRTLTFQAAMGASVPFPCRVQWVKRVGLFCYDLGLEFIDLDTTRKAQLAEMARVHGGRTMALDKSQAA